MTGKLATSRDYESVELTGNVGKAQFNGNVGALSVTGRFQELSLPGIQIRQTASGLVVVTNQPVQVQAPANGNAPSEAFAKALDVAPDGWIKTGVFSTRLGKEMELEPTPHLLNYYEAEKYAGKLRKTHKTAGQPTQDEQVQIYHGLKARGILNQVFDTQAVSPADFWWSSQAYYFSYYGRGLPLASGKRFNLDRDLRALARCVR